MTIGNNDKFDLKAQERMEKLDSHHTKINPSLMK
jgi:hypothetical protein